MKPSDVKTVSEAIAYVMTQVGFVQKEESDQLKYSFASEPAFIRAVRPHMVEVGLFIRPTKTEMISIDDFTSSKGTVIRSRIFKQTFTFEHAPSQTTKEVQVIGEGMDMGDKGSNKAMTVALKYALRQTLLIETGDDPDATASEDFAQEVGAKIYPQEYIDELRDLSPNAPENVITQVLDNISNVLGWKIPDVSVNSFKRVAEQYQAEQIRARQDNEQITQGELIQRAYDKLQADEQDEIPF